MHSTWLMSVRNLPTLTRVTRVPPCVHTHTHSPHAVSSWNRIGPQKATSGTRKAVTLKHDGHDDDVQLPAALRNF